MAYSSFSLKDVKQKLGVQVVENEKLFANINAVQASPFLRTMLEKYVPLALAINTEKSRSEWIIAPILAELRDQLHDQVSIFSGKKFDVDASRGLDGFCDYLISQGTEQYYIAAPVIAIVEAKNEDIVQGFGQCIATMVGARVFNEREQTQVPAIYGAVTTGNNWKFLKLEGEVATIDVDEYYLKEIEFLLGIFIHITQLATQKG
ncbi:MAG: hypothetical protein HOP19_05650 [Acidobacteria bacterium]|nr:hypothetical protein [Acidobacteriota bacterium]